MTVRRVVLLFLSFVLAAGLVVLLMRLGHIDPKVVWQQLRSVRAISLGKLVVLNAIFVAISTEKWRKVDAALRLPSDSVPSRLTAFSVTSVGMALGLVLPVQIGMTTARTMGTFLHGRALQRGTAGTLFEQGFDLMLMVFLAVASAVAWYLKCSALVWVMLAGIMTGVALVSVGFFLRAIRALSTACSSRRPKLKHRVWRALSELQYSSLLDVSLARQLLLLSVLRFAVLVLMAHETANAITVFIPLWHLAAAIPFVSISNLLALTPGGIGINELTSTTALSLFGTPLAVAAQWSLANRVLVIASCFAVAVISLTLVGVNRDFTFGANSSDEIDTEGMEERC